MQKKHYLCSQLWSSHFFKCMKLWNIKTFLIIKFYNYGLRNFWRLYRMWYMYWWVPNGCYRWRWHLHNWRWLVHRVRHLCWCLPKWRNFQRINCKIALAKSSSFGLGTFFVFFLKKMSCGVCKFAKKAVPLQRGKNGLISTPKSFRYVRGFL